MHNNIILTNAQTGDLLDSLQHNQNWRRPVGSTTSLVFGGKSRYLCIGDRSGAVCLWDLKKKVRARQFFHEGQPSIQVSLDRTDTYILSLSPQTLRSYKVREGVPSTSWSVPGHCRYMKFACSTLEPHLAAIGCDDGSILGYDISNPQSSQTTFTLKQRRDSPITSLAFSYTNDKLVASTSQDGSLQFYDKGSGALIEELARLPTSITSLTLNADGFSCAIGTEAGEILIYDLRRGGSNLASIYVQGAVRSLHFSPPPKNRNVGTAPTSSLYRVVSSTPDSKLDPTSKPRTSSSFSPPIQQLNSLSRPTSSVASEEEEPRTNYEAPFDGGYIGDNSRHGKSTGKPRSDSTYAGIESLPTHASVVPSTVGTTKGEGKAVPIEEIRDVIRNEVEKLQDELEESLRNLHMDMIKQFHQQSQELNAALTSQQAAMDQLREENQRLREENEFLKRIPPAHDKSETRENHRGNGVFYSR